MLRKLSWTRCYKTYGFCYSYGVNMIGYNPELWSTHLMHGNLYVFIFIHNYLQAQDKPKLRLLRLSNQIQFLA